MALYPKAKYRPVVGLEKDPPIIPVGVILHTRVGTGPSLFDYFNGPSGGIESHFYLTFDGHWEQYRDTEREADANLHANSFIVDGKRYGFLSIETEGFATDEWSPTQLAEIKAFLTWAHDTHGIPLRVCPAWNKAGVGYHTMWGAPGPWTPVAKDCPGPKRINQFNTVLVPWLNAPTAATEEDDMLSKEAQDWLEGRLDAHDQWLADHFEARIKAHRDWALANLNATLGREVVAVDAKVAALSAAAQGGSQMDVDAAAKKAADAAVTTLLSRLAAATEEPK